MTCLDKHIRYEEFEARYRAYRKCSDRTEAMSNCNAASAESPASVIKGSRGVLTILAISVSPIPRSPKLAQPSIVNLFHRSTGCISLRAFSQVLQVSDNRVDLCVLQGGGIKGRHL